MIINGKAKTIIYGSRNDSTLQRYLFLASLSFLSAFLPEKPHIRIILYMHSLK